MLGGAESPTSAGEPGRTEEAEEADGEEGDEFSTQGVEIEVTPAGKAMRRLSLLSGGEKALVALAFVFSVFLARPSPFYILDEVEAALDDANIDRFLQLVNRFSDRAQFIVVTHQKRTMDAAEVLYGVSMGKGGATKIVSRKFEAEQAQLEPRRSRRGLSSRSRSRMEWEDLARTLTITDGRTAAPDATARRSADSAERSRFARLRERLAKSRQALRAELSASLFDKIDSETWERLEEALILADVGVPATADVVGKLETEVEAGRGERAGGDPRTADRAARRARRPPSRRGST